MVEMKFNKKDLQRFTTRVKYCARFGQKNAKKMVSINKKVGKDGYIKEAKSKINDSAKDVQVWGDGKKGMIVERGTLRRSLGTWKTRRGETNVFAGPRSGHVHQSVKGTNRDGWHALIAEGGHAGDSKSHNTDNRHVFQKALKNTQGAMKVAQYAAYRKEFKKYMR